MSTLFSRLQQLDELRVSRAVAPGVDEKSYNVIRKTLNLRRFAPSYVRYYLLNHDDQSSEHITLVNTHEPTANHFVFSKIHDRRTCLAMQKKNQLMADIIHIPSKYRVTPRVSMGTYEVSCHLYVDHNMDNLTDLYLSALFSLVIVPTQEHKINASAFIDKFIIDHDLLVKSQQKIMTFDQYLADLRQYPAVSFNVSAILYTLYVYQILDRAERHYGRDLCRYVTQALSHLGFQNRTGRLCEEIRKRMSRLPVVDHQSGKILETYIRSDCHAYHITPPVGGVFSIGLTVENIPENTVIYFDSRLSDQCDQYNQLSAQVNEILHNEYKLKTEKIAEGKGASGSKCLIHFGHYIPSLLQLYQTTLLSMLSIPEKVMFPKMTLTEMVEPYRHFILNDQSLGHSVATMSYDDYFDYITESLNILPQTANNDVIGILYCIYVMIKVKI